MLRGIVSDFLAGVSLDNVMGYVERLSACDRYQASLGIEEAATFVAETARSIGLEEVSVERTAADGRARWWSFKAPVSWTPVTARFEIHNDHGLMFEVDHCRRPFSIATYSASTGPRGIVARLVNVGEFTEQRDLSGAIAVIDRVEFARREQISRLSSAGAKGFVTDAASCRTSGEPEHTGRIELDPGSELFAFSLNSDQFDAVRQLAKQDAQAKVVIDIDRSAMMPLVTALLPGKEAEEVWAIAHLCHPRPGANDNASGVAALLGAAAALVRQRRGDGSRDANKSIRFIWGPEFLASAAIIHSRMEGPGKKGLPAAVINLDMVGEDQERCGGPFVVERSPDFHASTINPITEHVVSEVFALTSNQPGTWKAAPFVGFSDHALFADRNVGVPAVHLCHARDRFNHSSGDSLDKVSKVEMLRATAATGTLAHLLTNNAALPPTARRAILEDWCKQENSAAQCTALEYREVEDGSWGQRLLRYTKKRELELWSLPEMTSGEVTTDSSKNLGEDSNKSAVIGQWSGPFNTRAMLADLPKESQATVMGLIRTDKRHLSLLFNFAIRADGQRTQNEVIDETSLALREPLDGRTAELLFNALIESGWVKKVLPVGNELGQEM